MAVDTRNKRASCVMLGVSPGRVFPAPDGALNNQADRQHLAYLYAAVLTGGPPAVPAIVLLAIRKS